jgi:hypothetical protein
MNIANQEVHVWQDHDYEWIPLRQYIEEVGLENLRPGRITSGTTEVRAFWAPGIVDCDPGGPNNFGGNEYDEQGRLIQTGREKQYVRWKKGRCAYIYYAGPHDGMYLMLPKPLKVTVEVKVHV